MSEIRKIVGSSLLSLMLVVWGLFMVCSGRVSQVEVEDEWWATEEEEDFEGDPQLMRDLIALEQGSSDLDTDQRREILAALGISEEEVAGASEEEAFLTEELFMDLETEIAELERLSRSKSQTIDSLQLELQETDYQLMALNNLVEPQPARTSTTYATAKQARGRYEYGDSPYALAYQDALNDVYDHNYAQAIEKFRRLLREKTTDELSDNCQYWIGESYYALGRYELAITEFEKVFAFENNNKSDDAQFMIGMAYLRIGERELARLELENLLDFYGNSEYVSRAESQLMAMRS